MALGRQSVDDAIERLRSAWVICCRNGEKMLIDCGQGAIDFAAKYTSAAFDTKMYFDFAEGRKKENYMKIVKEEENLAPGGIPGKYELTDTFSITFCTQSQDDAVVNELISKIPNSDKFRKIIIT